MCFLIPELRNHLHDNALDFLVEFAMVCRERSQGFIVEDDCITTVGDVMSVDD